MILIRFYGRKDLGTGILRNLTDGGEGTSGWIPSEEVRAKMSAANTGKKQSAEHTAKNTGENNHMYGKHHSPETIAKRNATRKNNKESKNLVEKLAELLKSITETPIANFLQ
jgi:hypothetical protein